MLTNLNALWCTPASASPINRKDPDELFGASISRGPGPANLQDGKTFVDVVPKKRWRRIQREYLEASKKPDFNLQNLSINIFMILIRRTQVTCLSQPNQRASMSRSYGRN